MAMTSITIDSTNFNRNLRGFVKSGGHVVNKLVWRQIKQDAIDKQTISATIMNKDGYIPYIEIAKRNGPNSCYEGNDVATLVDYILENEKNKLDAEKMNISNAASTATSAINTTTATINSTLASHATISNATTTTTNPWTFTIPYNADWETVSAADLVDFVNTKKKEKEKEKENNMMFNFDFGKITSDSVRMSMYGIAVKNVEGRYVAYDSANHSVMDVDVLNMPAGDFLYKMPVAIKDIKTGDVVIHNRVPMFVVEVHASTLKVVDIREGAEKEIYLTKSPFGFNFATKVVSLIDMTKVNANAENPFGTMLPFMLMDGSKEMDPMMLMLAMNNGMDFSANPMMMYFLMKDGDHKDMLPMLMMMNMNTKKE